VASGSVQRAAGSYQVTVLHSIAHAWAIERCVIALGIMFKNCGNNYSDMTVTVRIRSVSLSRSAAALLQGLSLVLRLALR
jgi:hypothetical protein